MPDLNNYKNMSMESLGSMLIGQKAAGEKRIRRRTRKDDKINKILAVLLGGQAMFKEALKDRLLEVDQLELVQKMSDSKAATEMQSIAQIYSGLDKDFLLADDAWDKYQDYDNNAEQINIFREGAANALTAIIQKQNPTLVKELEDMRILEMEVRSKVDKYMAPYFFGKLSTQDAIALGNKEWAGKTRAQVITTGAMDYFGTDAEEALNQMFSVDTNILQGNRLKNKILKERELGSKARLIPTISNLFKGEATIFSKGDPTEVEGIKKVLEVTDLDQFMAPKLKEIMIDLRGSLADRAMDKARMNETAMEKDPAKGRFNRISQQVIQERKEALSSGSPAELERLSQRVFVSGQETSLGEAYAHQIRLLEMSHKIIFNAEGTDLDQKYGNTILAQAQVLVDHYEGRDQTLRDAAIAQMKISNPKLNFDKALPTDIYKAAYLSTINNAWAAATPEDYINTSFRGKGPSWTLEPGEPGFIAGELAIDAARPRAWRPSIREERKSNLIPKNIDRLSAHYTPAIREVGPDGKPVYSEELLRLIEYADAESIDNARIVVSNYLNDVQDRGYGQEGEQILEVMLNDDRVNKIFSDTEDKGDLLDSYRSGKFSLYQPVTTSAVLGMPYTSITDTSAYEDFTKETPLDEIYPERKIDQYDIPQITSLLDRE